ncbi:MAG TPA: Dabb family protein [Nocardioides sp.]|nr:Dabb family protein [Nocardioides sp.]
MTTRHLVMFRRLADVPADAANEADLMARLDALGATIAGIESWRVAANEHDRPVCWDHVLEADLTDDAALATYLAHPEHQALLPDLRAYFDMAVVDYATGGPDE